MEIKKFAFMALGLLVCGIFSCVAFADDNDDDGDDNKEKIYKVTITNITSGQSFTPVLAISHTEGHPVFMLGQPASPELAAIAEGGDTSGLNAMLMDNGTGFDSASGTGLIGPGQSETLIIRAKGKYRYVSVASMLLPTNDGFFAVNGMKLPKKHKKMVLSPAYDAGSEMNDELCAHIPGPHCGGEAFSDGDAEGYVHIHSGINGIGDLDASVYDWKNPVASIMIERMD